MGRRCSRRKAVEMDPKMKQKVTVGTVAILAVGAVAWTVRVAVREFGPPKPRVDFDDPNVRARFTSAPPEEPYLRAPLPEWKPANPWWKRNTIDAYDAMKYPTDWPGA